MLQDIGKKATPSILLVSQAKQIEVNILNGSSLHPLYPSYLDLP